MRFTKAYSLVSMAVATAALSVVSGGVMSGSASGATALTPITVTYAATGAGFTDLYVGVHDGIFAKNGLAVTLNQITPSSLVPALLNGSVQIGSGVADSAAEAILGGENLRFIALSEGTYNVQLWTSDSITSMSQLAGKSIGMTTQTSETDFALNTLLQMNNMSSSSVQRDYLVTAAEQLSALQSGAVAAVLMQPPSAQALASRGFHALSTKQGTLQGQPFAVGAYITTSSYLQHNPKVIKEFVTAEAQSLAFLRSNPAQTLKAIENYSGYPTLAYDQIAYKFFLNVWKTTPVVTPSLIVNAFAAAAAIQNVSAPKTVSQYIYTLPKAKTRTITCVRGKITKKVRAVSPKCPVGYTKK